MKALGRLIGVLSLGFFLCAFLAPAEAQAQTMRWRIEKTYPGKIHVEFYSQNRKHAWPDGGKTIVLTDNSTVAYDIECNLGEEKVCLGAWPEGVGKEIKYWGRRAQQCG